MKVLIAGATGLVGSKLLELLVDDPSITEIVVLSRRVIETQSSKIKLVICDYDNLESSQESMQVDCVFCCLGTTIKKAGSKESFKKVDYEYPLKLAKLSLESGVRKFLIITAMGADHRSLIFYNKIKGEVQESLKKLNFTQLHFIQPSLILGERSEKRLAEQFFAKLSPMLNPLFIGPIQKYKAIEANQIAKAMQIISYSEKSGVYIHPSNELAEY